MSQQIYPLRLSRRDRRLFGQAARAEQKTIAEWLREAGRQHAGQGRKRAACLEYSDRVVLSPEAESNPKAFIRSKLRTRRAIHR